MSKKLLELSNPNALLKVWIIKSEAKEDLFFLCQEDETSIPLTKAQIAQMLAFADQK